MDLRSLRYYVSAVNEGSISAASQKCHVAQPSITLAISKLEDEFGCQLLNRHRKGVSVTEAGQEFYDRAIELLQHADSMKTNFGSGKAKLKLSLAVHRSVQLRYVEHIMHAIRDLDLPLEFVINEDSDVSDLALSPKQQRSNTTKQSIFYPIATERYCLLIPPNMHLAHQTKVTLKDLDGQAIIERSACENRPLFDHLIQHFKLNLPVCATVDNEEWALALVAAGVGMSISPVPIGFKDPRFVVRDIGELLEIQTPERQIGLSFDKNLSSDIQAVLDQIGHHFTHGQQYQTRT